MNLTQRTVQSSLWNISVNMVQLGLTFVRSVLLARWLNVDLFGIYAYAGSIVAFSQVLPRFGLGGAFLNRVPETEDEDFSASIHFTLQMIFTCVWAIVIILGGFFVFETQIFIPLACLVLFEFVSEFSFTPRMILVRRVTHRRLATIALVDSILSTAVSLVIAWNGGGIWALLSMNIITAMSFLVGLYLWKPVWRPKFRWAAAEIKYYLSFGRKNLAAIILRDALDNLDDIWTGFFLGETPLAYYSKAYSFALLPGKVLGSRIDSVISGSYAELKNKRASLSKAFSLANEIMLRSSFLIGGIFFAVAPGLIRVLLGEKWMPMVLPFQLMLVYTLLNPIKTNIGNLFVAIGEPGIIVRARVFQLVIMLAGIFALGFKFGIIGVAIAMDLMLLFGLIHQLILAGVQVDFSWKELFFTPTICLLGGVLAYLVLSNRVHPEAELLNIVLTAFVFLMGFVGFYFGLEGRKFKRVYLPMIRDAIPLKFSMNIFRNRRP